MNHVYSLLLVFLLGACTGPREALEVKQFQLREQVPLAPDEPMTRMEKERRLHGAVTLAERRNRLGQYFDLLWNDPTGVNQGDVELVFEYQQGAYASLVKRKSQKFAASSASGTAEFAVTGDDFFSGGKVIAWKAMLLRGKRVIATRQSYLWQ